MHVCENVPLMCRLSFILCHSSGEAEQDVLQQQVCCLVEFQLQLSPYKERSRAQSGTALLHPGLVHSQNAFLFRFNLLTFSPDVEVRRQRGRSILQTLTVSECFQCHDSGSTVCCFNMDKLSNMFVFQMWPHPLRRQEVTPSV